MTKTATTTVVAENWGWRHAGRTAWAVHDANFQAAPGERILIVGPSGSGKSTLLSGLAGLLGDEEGEAAGSLKVGDQGSPRGLVGLVQQDPDSQIVMATIGDEVAFGCENLGVPKEEIWSRVESALNQVGLLLPLDHPTDKLSGGQKQRLALAAALAMHPQVLLLDEPTANLDPDGVFLVREAISRIAATGITVIMVEHRVEAWSDLMDRMIVMEEGKIVADGPTHQVLSARREVLAEAGVWVPGVPLPFSTCSPRCGPIVLRAHGVSIGYDAIVRSNVTLDLSEGVSTCITGANGTGKTTLALTLAGLLPTKAGAIDLDGSDPASWDAPRLARTIGMVFQEPSYQFLTQTVRAELELGGAAADRVDHFLEVLRLSHLQQAHPLSLSGGEKRRLSVATALIRSPRIVILDEPTFGQDRNTWIALVALIRRIASEGTTVICVTHDESFIAAIGENIVELVPRPAHTIPEKKARYSPLRGFNPLIQIVALAVLTVPLLFTIDIVSAAVALGLELLILPLLGWSPTRLIRRVWPLLTAAPLAAFSMLLYAKASGAIIWSWGPVVVSENSIELATAIALRVLAVGIPALCLLSDLDATETADSLMQIGRLPPALVLATLAGIRLVSLMLSDWDALKRARRSRGVTEKSRLRGFFLGAFSLFAFALRRAGTLSATMEARGFGAPIRRSYARESTVTMSDAVMVLVALALVTTALLASIASGHFRWFGV